MSKSAKILVVDDEENMRESLKDIFEEENENNTSRKQS